MVSLQVSRNFILIGTFYISASSSFFLDFLPFILSYNNLPTDNLKYPFFIFNVLVSIALFLTLRKETLCEIFPFGFFLFVFSLLFFLNSTLDSPLHSLKTLSIVMTLSLISMVAGAVARVFFQNNLSFLRIILLIPFLFPVICSIILECIGAFQIFEFTIENVKQNNFIPPRWHFLYSSANGLGLACAFAIYFSYWQLLKCKSFIFKGFCALLVASVLFVLIKTGTRAALMLALVSVICLHLASVHSKIKVREFFILSIVIFCGVILLLNFVSFDFRWSGSLNDISSGRFNGMIAMYEVIIEHPIFGIGFGGTDYNSAKIVDNNFYFGLVMEIGLIGSAFCFFFLLYPVGVFIQKKMSYLGQSCVVSQNDFVTGSIALVIGLLVYSNFEFVLFRVSAANNLLFFLMGYLHCHFNLIRLSRSSQVS